MSDPYLEFRHDYASDPARRRALDRFTRTIFQFDFARWHRSGWWDPRYVPFSLFHGRTVVSNVSLYSVDLVVRGEVRRAAQISTVGTLPGWRRRGYARLLLDRALEWAAGSHDFDFLFSNPKAFPLYEGAGFRRIRETKALVETRSVSRRPGARPLNENHRAHRELLETCAERREPVSERLGVLSPRLLLWHCLYRMKGAIHHIPALDLVVLARREGRRLVMLDVVGPEVPPFDEIYPYLSRGRAEEVEFRFETDKMDLRGIRWEDHPSENAHVRRRFPFAGRRALFPETGRA